jgi:hypothetical protein
MSRRFQDKPGESQSGSPLSNWVPRLGDFAGRLEVNIPTLPHRTREGWGSLAREPRLGCGEVLLFQDSAVVEFVAGDCIGQRADGHFIVVGDAAPGPGFLVQIAEQG